MQPTSVAKFPVKGSGLTPLELRCYMKLSWLSTSEAHKQAKHIIYECAIWNDARHNIKERESKSQWIKRKHRDLFRGSSTQLYVPAFTQKDFQSTNLSTQDSHTGNLHWGFGTNTIGSTQLLSQPNTTLTRGKAQPTTNTSTLRGLGT